MNGEIDSNNVSFIWGILPYLIGFVLLIGPMYAIFQKQINALVMGYRKSSSSTKDGKQDDASPEKKQKEVKPKTRSFIVRTNAKFKSAVILVVRDYTLWPVLVILLGVITFFLWDGVSNIYKKLQGQPVQLVAQPVESFVELDVSHPRWTLYGLYVSKGDRIAFNAHGKYIWDPKVNSKRIGPEGDSFWPMTAQFGKTDFLFPHAPIAALICKIGDKGTVKFIGSGAVFVSEDEGYLHLAINERWVLTGGGNYRDNWRDNSGTIHVRINIT